MRCGPTGLLCLRQASAAHFHARRPQLLPASVAIVPIALPSPSWLVAQSHGSQSRRAIHSSDRKSSTMTDLPGMEPPTPFTEPSRPTPLSVLPLSMIVRSLGTNVVSSSPLLLAPSLHLMSWLAHSSSPLLNPDRNPLLRFILKKSFYAQFCAGENAFEVGQTVARLKNIGFTGVILGYAKEVVLSGKQAGKVAGAGHESPEALEREIKPWAEGTLETVRLTAPGDFTALKFSGAGSVAFHRLAHRMPASPVLHDSIDAICRLARERGVRLLFDAEQDMLQHGIDDWTMEFARKYNTDPASATVWGTYQAYKKATPAVLSRHLAEAREGGFSLGVKLVRGAYLGADPRECFWATKSETDACYDDIAAGLLKRQWGSVLAGSGEFPATHLILATHNADSVRRARAICEAGSAKSDVAFAQLQGMADEISCELVEASKSTRSTIVGHPAPTLPAYKYLVWGTTGECMKYLLRRAQENKDAVQRTRSGRDAMWAELVRRVKQSFRFSAF